MRLERGRVSLFNAPRRSVTGNILNTKNTIKSKSLLRKKTAPDSPLTNLRKSRNRSPMRLTRGVSRDKSASKKKSIINSQKIIGLDSFNDSEPAYRELNPELMDSYTRNPLEDFFFENMNFENAFNRFMVGAMGDEFCASPFCLPVFVIRFKSVIVRSLFSGNDFLEGEEGGKSSKCSDQDINAPKLLLPKEKKEISRRSFKNEEIAKKNIGSKMSIQKDIRGGQPHI